MGIKLETLFLKKEDFNKGNLVPVIYRTKNNYNLTFNGIITKIKGETYTVEVKEAILFEGKLINYCVDERLGRLWIIESIES